MLAENLKRLPNGTRLWWVIGEGISEVRHPAKLVGRRTNQVDLLVYFLDKRQGMRRWSLLTNQPVWESRGHVGKIRLELDDGKAEPSC